MTVSKLVYDLFDKATSTATTTSATSSVSIMGGEGDCTRKSSWSPSLSGRLSSQSDGGGMVGITPYLKNNNDNTGTNHLCAILACSSASSSSSSSSSTQRNQARLLASKAVGTGKVIVGEEGYYGPLCQYRKGFVDHLTPKAFLLGTIRVGVQQGTIVLAGFMTDQVEQDLKRHKMVDEGKITTRESEEQAEEWEKIEWERRWKIFPQKFLTAFAKYHATTLVLRLYEWITARWVTNQRMDMLTMDPFAASRTLANKVDVRSHPMYAANRIAHTTFWANLLFTLSDYTVHQALLCYAYYVYYQRKQQRRRTEGGEASSAQQDDNRVMATSFVNRSGQLFASRGFALICSSIGAGVGTIVQPGWGTLMVSSMGEGAATTIVDDGTSAAMAALTKSNGSASAAEL